MLGALRPALRTAVPRAASLRALPLTPLSRAAQPSSSQSRAFSSTPRAQLQNLFEAPETPALAITKLDSRGFLLSDGLLVNGGVVFADGRALLWDVDPPRGDGSQGLAAAWEGWSPERFKVLETLVPRPEILIFGTGERVLPAPKAIRDYISSLGIQLDVMDSRNAASTYNLLFEEGRTISAALCPLKAIDRNFTYLGYELTPSAADTEVVPFNDRPMQVFILAKRIQYFYKSWAPACFEREMITKALFELRKEFPTLEFVGSFYDDRSKADHERLGPMSIPEGVKHIGKLNATQWDDAIKNSRLLMGVGWPTSSPSPYRALARGVPFLNPHNVNDRESEDDPSSWGFVQHDALRRISEPYVYNVQQHDYEAFVGAIRKALTTETPVYRLERMERHALDKRVSDFMEMDWYSEARQILEIRKAGKEENSVGGVGLLEM